MIDQNNTDIQYLQFFFIGTTIYVALHHNHHHMTDHHKNNGNYSDLNEIRDEVRAAFDRYMQVYFTERDVDKTFAMFDEEMTT